MKIYAATDIGMSRNMNQDYLFASETPVGNLPNLLIAADGMGGHVSGEFASKFTVDEIVKSIRENAGTDAAFLLREAVLAANRGLISYAREHQEMSGMGTTVVAAALAGTRLVVANVGDSRLYLAGSEMVQVTEDHSLVQQMVRLGELDPAEAKNHPDRNIITRAVGADENLTVDIYTVEAVPGDFILLCTDGLTNMVEDSVLFQILKENGKELPEKGKQLLDLANANGGKDNITVIVAEIGE